MNETNDVFVIKSKEYWNFEDLARKVSKIKKKGPQSSKPSTPPSNSPSPEDFP
jgi:hypothetical protein